MIMGLFRLMGPRKAITHRMKQNDGWRLLVSSSRCTRNLEATSTNQKLALPHKEKTRIRPLAVTLTAPLAGPGYDAAPSRQALLPVEAMRVATVRRMSCNRQDATPPRRR